MRCEWIDENADLYIYGELEDHSRHQVDEHLATCERCRQTVASVAQMRSLLLLDSIPEPSPNLVAQARLRLDEALDRLPAPGRMSRLGQLFGNSFAHLRAAPVLAGTLLLAGIAGGGFAGWQLSEVRAQRALIVSQSANQTASGLPDGIANISSVVQQPNSNLVQVQFNRLVPGSAQGSPNDPAIHELLLLATQNRSNPGVRVDSVGLLADSCRDGSCTDSGKDSGVREALMAALRYDKNAGVRLKALDGLGPYVGQDVRVRDSVLAALMDDNNPGVRTEAIHLLSPVESDGSVREVLHTVAAGDQSPYIRTASRQVLENGPEIQ